MTNVRWWPPAVVLAVGALAATLGVRAQRTLSLRTPLAEAVPASLDGFRSRDITLTADEERVAGVSNYLSRIYEAADSASAPRYVLVYVGYYERQTQGRSIHSPKNCLPGAGWEALTSAQTDVPTAAGPVRVNRYLIQKGAQRALVLYWYQGRGRVADNEYRVKWDLLRDAALRRRSEEALVRVVVPFIADEREALALATSTASRLVPAVYTALPS